MRPAAAPPREAPREQWRMKSWGSQLRCFPCKPGRVRLNTRAEVPAPEHGATPSPKSENGQIPLPLQERAHSKRKGYPLTRWGALRRWTWRRALLDGGRARLWRMGCESCDCLAWRVVPHTGIQGFQSESKNARKEKHFAVYCVNFSFTF